MHPLKYMFRPFMLLLVLRLNLNFWVQDDCKFMAGFGESVEKMHPPGHDIVAFRWFPRVNIVYFF